MTSLEDLEARSGLRFFSYQREALDAAVALPGPQQRTCLYYKTGAGKSITALASMALWGVREVVVITPPSTYEQWQRFADLFGMTVTCMSHARFRMPKTKLSRNVAVIADEMHLFGSNTGAGWKKLDAMARHLQAPLILVSATPNYNDAERVYCVKHILDPHGTKGGYLEFLYLHCRTRQSAFSMKPDVEGFLRYKDAAEFLADLPGVQYLADDLTFTTVDLTVKAMDSPPMDTYGYNQRDHRMLASLMEERHVRIFQTLVAPDGFVYDDVRNLVAMLIKDAPTPVLIFCVHATVARALARTFERDGVKHGLVTGNMSTDQKADVLRDFLFRRTQVLVGTASLATGTDGLDKVCDWLLILDDTEDAAMRRQLIGRIMPRGLQVDASMKRVFMVEQQ